MMTRFQLDLPSVICLKMYVRCVSFQERGALSPRSIMTRHLSQKGSQNSDYFDWLDSLAMKFGLSGNKVTVIHEPCDFYQTLIDKCRSARRRITLASLYIGTGSLERKLVDTISERLSESSKTTQSLKVKVLLDSNRGSRGKENSRTLLCPLVKLYPGSCQVALYRTPILSGVLGNIIPQRWNEVFGLQHMKIYLFDNSLIISGANLSHDYFTNRQDRYMLVEDCQQLADFYDGLVSCISNFSDVMKSSESLATKNFAGVVRSMSPGKELLQYYNNYKAGRECELAKEIHDTNVDTWIYPLIEAGQLGVHQDSKVTEILLKSVPHGSTLHLTTGYFNLTKNYSDAIIQESIANYHVLMAHPTANGFLNARGIAGSIPTAYTLLARTFFNKVLAACGKSGRIGLWEYCRDGWTFHAKGLWFTPGNTSLLPSLTLVGSPNFGYRSVERDLETQIAVITHNSGLQKRLAEERDRLYARAPEKVTEETFTLPGRHVPFWVRCFVWLFRSYF